MEAVVGNAISVCMNKYAVFSGRASRSEFWYFALFTSLLSWAVQIIGNMIGSLAFTVILTLAWYGIFLIPILAVAARRMHDVGKSGGFYLIPIYNIILACTAGTGPNQYGDANA